MVEVSAVDGQPTPGDVFNPWRQVCGFYAPDVVARDRSLTDGQKRLYERLVRWAGKRGSCWYGFDTMADALGKSARQVKRDVEVLEQRALICRTRRGKRLSNTYEFLWHTMFSAALSEVTPASLKGECDEVPPMSLHEDSEVTDSAMVKCHIRQSEVTPASPELGNESCKGNSVRNTHRPVRTACARVTDSRFEEGFGLWPNQQKKEKAEAAWNALLSTAAREQMAIGKIHRFLRTKPANPADMESWLIENVKAWRDSPIWNLMA